MRRGICPLHELLLSSVESSERGNGAARAPEPFALVTSRVCCRRALAILAEDALLLPSRKPPPFAAIPAPKGVGLDGLWESLPTS